MFVRIVSVWCLWFVFSPPIHIPIPGVSRSSLLGGKYRTNVFLISVCDSFFKMIICTKIITSGSIRRVGSLVSLRHVLTRSKRALATSSWLYGSLVQPICTSSDADSHSHWQTLYYAHVSFHNLCHLRHCGNCSSSSHTHTASDAIHIADNVASARAQTSWKDLPCAREETRPTRCSNAANALGHSDIHLPACSNKLPYQQMHVFDVLV